MANNYMENSNNEFNIRDKIEEMNIDSGSSFGGKGRGFKTVENSEGGSGWGSDNRGSGFGGERRGRGGGRGGRFDGDRDGGNFRRRNNNGDGNSNGARDRDNANGHGWKSQDGGRRNNSGGDWDSRGGERRNMDHGDNWGGADSHQGGWNDGDGDKRRGGPGGRRFQRRDGDDNYNSGSKSNDDNFGGNKGGEEGQEKRAPLYFPKEKTEEELWADSGITKGIHFKDYQNIKANVSGRDPPKKINSFCDAQFCDLLLGNLRKSHYDEPTPVQQWAIPIIMNKRDLMATAQTGSGKTAAYLLPTIHMILREKNENTSSVCAPQILVLSPTRELAIQIHEVAKKFAQSSYLKVRILYGGTSTGYQNKQLQEGCDILVATPGRLKDFVNRNNLNFGGIRFLILDEADRMLDMGFRDDIQTICSHESMTPKDQRQTLMFSATFSDAVQRLAHNYLNDYIFVAIGIVGGACKDVKQNIIAVSRNDKKKKLKEILDESNDVRGTLLFVETKRTADFIASYLSSSDFPTTSIHGDRFQSQREEALRDFKNRTMKILVATSVAARGLDINGVKHVINYDLPESIDEYVHRIGRTGRLGNQGLATSFYDPDIDSRVAPHLIRILKQADQEVPPFLENAASSGAGFVSNDGFGGYDYREKSNDGASFKTGSGNQPVAINDDDDDWS